MLNEHEQNLVLAQLADARAEAYEHWSIGQAHEYRDPCF